MHVAYYAISGHKGNQPRARSPYLFAMKKTRNSQPKPQKRAALLTFTVHVSNKPMTPKSIASRGHRICWRKQYRQAAVFAARILMERKYRFIAITEKPREVGDFSY
jgi:hypothetical protein